MNKTFNQKDDEIKFSDLCSKFKNRHLNILDIERIIYCEAAGSYTWIYLTSGNKIKVSCRIKKVEEKLNYDNIVRCHRSYLVNVKYISEISENRPFSIKLSNGDLIRVTNNKFEDLLVHTLQNI